MLVKICILFNIKKKREKDGKEFVGVKESFCHHTELTDNKLVCLVILSALCLFCNRNLNWDKRFMAVWQKRYFVECYNWYFNIWAPHILCPMLALPQVFMHLAWIFIGKKAFAQESRHTKETDSAYLLWLSDYKSVLYWFWQGGHFFPRWRSREYMPVWKTRFWCWQKTVRNIGQEWITSRWAAS